MLYFYHTVTIFKRRPGFGKTHFRPKARRLLTKKISYFLFIFFFLFFSVDLDISRSTEIFFFLKIFSCFEIFFLRMRPGLVSDTKSQKARRLLKIVTV